ncbi:MAG: fumarylacetoacetate hydrolase family protein [Burkholderiaceae bacterium]
MNYVFPPSPVMGVPIVGSDALFPARRIYCVGRNYEDHAKEMGFTGREPPFFFLKPVDALVMGSVQAPAQVPYPPMTRSFHHEVELVVAIGMGGADISVNDAPSHVFGYAVGLDMTRRDQQNEMKKLGRPWCIGKGFDFSAPIGPITPLDIAGDMSSAEIELAVNGSTRQRSRIDKLIWSVPEVISHVSKAWRLHAGDLIFTGTPEGVNTVVTGDSLLAMISGLTNLEVVIR